MDSPRIVVAIATRERAALLERTLRSLAQCEVPGALERVVVVENGPVRAGERVVGGMVAPFRCDYWHQPAAGKNRALNEVVAAYPDAFVVFFDDDVRLDRRVLVEYAGGLRSAPEATFFGGRCLVDYDERPAEWLMRYLPESAKGWSRGPQPCQIRQAMGFNWGAHARAILAAGGFAHGRGPGMHHSIGDETEMQERLVRCGGTGHYLPNALVWHYVPRERCSPAWAIARARQMGIARGIQAARWPTAARMRLAASCRRKARVLAIAAGPLGAILGPRQHCHCRRARQWKLGVLEGLAIAEATEVTAEGAAELAAEAPDEEDAGAATGAGPVIGAPMARRKVIVRSV